MADKQPATDGYFGIKSIAASDRALILAAARRADKSVGEWVGEAARFYVASQRTDIIGDVLPPEVEHTVAVVKPNVQRSAEELTLILNLAERVARLKGRTLSPRSVTLVAIQRQLRGLLRS